MYSIITLPAGVLVPIAGLWLATAPPERILRFDRRAGYSAYCREMKRSGDRTKALRAASRYYRVIAALVIPFGAAWLIASFGEILGIWG